MSLYQEWFTATADKITVKTAPETVQKANNSFSVVAEPDPAPKVAPRRADDLDARTADLRSFVGRVVSNDQMYVLMRRSNRGPVKVWGEWYNSTTWPCDHLIRGWWEAVNA